MSDVAGKSVREACVEPICESAPAEAASDDPADHRIAAQLLVRRVESASRASQPRARGRCGSDVPHSAQKVGISIPKSKSPGDPP